MQAISNRSELDEMLQSLVRIETTGCTKCDEGFIVDFKSQGLPRVVGECECMPARKAEKLTEWKTAEADRLIKSMLPKYDLRNTQIYDWYSKIPEGSCYFWGPTREGKSHAMGWALLQQIRRAVSPFKWVRVKAWELSHAFDYEKDPDQIWQHKSRNLLDLIDQADVIHIEELDKFGNFTLPRWVKFFAVTDQIIEAGKKLRISSQYPISHIIAQMPEDKKIHERDGIGSSESRFQNLMRGAEIYAG